MASSARDYPPDSMFVRFIDVYMGEYDAPAKIATTSTKEPRQGSLYHVQINDITRMFNGFVPRRCQPDFYKSKKDGKTYFPLEIKEVERFTQLWRIILENCDITEGEKGGLIPAKKTEEQLKNFLYKSVDLACKQIFTEWAEIHPIIRERHRLNKLMNDLQKEGNAQSLAQINPRIVYSFCTEVLRPAVQELINRIQEQEDRQKNVEADEGTEIFVKRSQMQLSLERCLTNLMVQDADSTPIFNERVNGNINYLFLRTPLPQKMAYELKDVPPEKIYALALQDIKSEIKGLKSNEVLHENKLYYWQAVMKFFAEEKEVDRQKQIDLAYHEALKETQERARLMTVAAYYDSAAVQEEEYFKDEKKAEPLQKEESKTGEVKDAKKMEVSEKEMRALTNVQIILNVRDNFCIAQELIEQADRKKITPAERKLVLDHQADHQFVRQPPHEFLRSIYRATQGKGELARTLKVYYPDGEVVQTARSPFFAIQPVIGTAFPATPRPPTRPSSRPPSQ